MLRLVAPAFVIVFCISTASAATLKLANGDTLTGEIVDWAVDHVVIDHPQLGRVRLSLDQLEIDTGESPNRGLFGTGFLRGWKRGIDLGFTGKQGNSELTNITAGLDFGYEDEFKRWKLDGRYYFNRDEDGISDNYAIFNLKRDWLFPGRRWLVHSSFRYQYDEFESWRHRMILAVAPGYQLVEGEAHTLDVILGPAFTREFGERQLNRAEVLFGLDYSWKPAERYTLSLSNQLFVTYKPEAGDMRNMSNADLKIALLEEPALSFKVGAQNEYETNPEAEDKKNDLKYYLSLGLDF